MRNRYIIVAAVAALLAAQGARSQEIEKGVTVQRGWLNSRKPIEPIQVKNTNGDQVKGMHKVAISVFNVEFPDEFDLKAVSSGSNGFMASRNSATLHTRLVGMDLAARQRIADAAYADFVGQLKAAGFEVMDHAALLAAAPEMSTWTTLPNGSPGRFGTYVAPSGLAVYPMNGDARKRETSGMFHQLNQIASLANTSQAYKRSAYVARDADTYVLAVSMVVDYAVYSTSGDRRGFGKRVSAGFEEGAAVAAGTLIDPATTVRVWNTHSGGFPTLLTLQQPVISDADIGPATGSPGDWTITTTPDVFTPAATDVIERANGALVATLVAGRGGDN